MVTKSTILGSTHGTFLDGNRIAPYDPQPIVADTKIRFGKSTRIYKLATGTAAGVIPVGGGGKSTGFHELGGAEKRARLEELAKAFKYMLKPGERSRRSFIHSFMVN